MAKNVIAVTGRTATEFETNFATALAGVLTSRIDIASFTVTELTRLQGVEYRALVVADDTAGLVITNPYKVEVFQAKSVEELATALTAFYTANPTIFAAPPVMAEGMQVRNDSQSFAVLVYNDDAAEGASNWSGGTAGNIGPATGDLDDSFPAPTVVKIQGRNIDNNPGASGDILMFNGSGYGWTQEVLAFATGADAASAAPLINGRRILITTGGDLGLWQVVSNNGATFPGDYIQLTTTATLAEDWSVNDADGLFQGVTGEVVLRELVAPPSRTVVATPDTIVSDDHVIVVDLSTIGAVTSILLPAAPVSDERHVVCDGTGQAGDFTITVDGNGNTINGETEYAINIDYGSATFQWDVIAGEWRVLAGYLEQPRIKLRASLSASALNSPQNNDWIVNNLAGLGADDNNRGLDVRLFDDSVEQGVGFKFEIPTGSTNMTVTLWSRARVTPLVDVDVVPKLYVRTFPDNAAPTAWSAGTLLTALEFTTNEHFQKDQQTIPLSTLGAVAGRVNQFELTRAAGEAADTLVDDWSLMIVVVEFS